MEIKKPYTTANCKGVAFLTIGNQLQPAVLAMSCYLHIIVDL